MKFSPSHHPRQTLQRFVLPIDGLPGVKVCLPPFSAPPLPEGVFTLPTFLAVASFLT